MHEPEANAQPSSMAPARIGAYFASRRRALVALAVALVAIGFWRMTGGASEGSPEASLAAVLARRGQTVDTASVLWLDRPSSGWRRVRAVWLGHAEGEPADVFAGDVRLKANGAVVDVAWVSNLTRTAGADETLLARLGDHVAYASRVDGKLEAVTVLDFAGEPVELTRDWPLRARLQNAITNLQETGRFRGVGRQRYRIVAPVERFSLAATARTFEAHVGAEAVIELDPRRTAPVRGADLVESRPAAKGMPGTISWVVDTVRNSPWVGREPIEWLEHTVFSAKDWAERKWYAIVGTDTEEAVAEELGVAQVSERTRIELSTTNVETGWPPAPMKPPLGKVKHEGEWMPVVNDPFVKARPGEPPLFYQSFLRVDPERDYTRVYVNVWDPRILELHIVAGTREPESATGETGTGMAPRDPAVLERVVAGFNGGFQALHGEFGMMAEGRVYLPPKPWAATVATYRDGSMAMGSWAGPPKGVREYEEQWAVAQIPTDMLGLRQNLTSVVEDGRYNPWERWWWGAAPLNADEQTLIDRSGLCLTTEGFLAYFWGQSMSADALGAAMLAARCVRGVHLDMNSAHTGFEYYNVSRTAFSPLGRELTDDEYDGPTPLAPSLFLRARRMVRTMSTMRFPRYIGRDARDFFYLTMR
ncbi:MAG: hypothetical protein KC417_11550, partial [Myxococcales bacterium]|nr:hypothetical protein [Myxococcales bacterium]